MSASPLAQRMRVAILGAGALGLMFARRLSETMDVTVHSRRGVALTGRAVRIVGATDHLARNDAFVTSSGQVARSCDLIIVLSSSWDLDFVLGNLGESDCPVVSLQNGMGIQERLRSDLGGRFRYGATYESASVDFSTTEITIQHWRRSSTFVGAAGESDAVLDRFAELARSAGVDVALVTSKESRAIAWMKAAVASAISPLATLLDAPVDRLGRPEMLAIATGVCRELQELAEAEGIVMPSPGIELRVVETINDYAGSITSMTAQMRSGRCTEIEPILGYFVQRADERGISLTVSRVIYALARARFGRQET